MKAILSVLAIACVLNLNAQVYIQEDFNSPSATELVDVNIISIANSYDGSPCAVVSNSQDIQSGVIDFEPVVIPDGFDGLNISFVSQLEADSIPEYLGGLPPANFALFISSNQEPSYTGENTNSSFIRLDSINQWVEHNVELTDFYYPLNVGDTLYVRMLASHNIWGILSIDNFVVSNLYAIGTNELLVFLNNFGQAVDEDDPCYLDSDGNGVTNINDFLDLMTIWGTTFSC